MDRFVGELGVVFIDEVFVEERADCFDLCGQRGNGGECFLEILEVLGEEFKLLVFGGLPLRVEEDAFDKRQVLSEGM
jgi:hypothetical protein